MSELTLYLGLIVILGSIAWLSDREIKISKAKSREAEQMIDRERKRLVEIVSKQKHNLQGIKDSYKENLTSDDYLKDLWKGLFHDLLSPLASVSLYLERLGEKGIAPNEAQELVSKTIASSRRMESFMASIKKSFNENRNFDRGYGAELCEELRSVSDLLAYKARMAGVILHIKHCESVTIPNINPIRIYQIFLNIISNAIESYEHFDIHDEQRVVEISILKGDVLAKITITDNGCGINDTEVKTLGDKSFSGNKNSTGVGLMTVKNIITRELGGTMNIESAKDKGTKVEIHIPFTPLIASS